MRAPTASHPLLKLESRGLASTTCGDAFSCYSLTRRNSPCPLLIPRVFKACAGGSVAQGHCVHADVIKLGFVALTSVGNSLVSFYMKCRSPSSAAAVFHGMAPAARDSVTWNSIIHGFLNGGDHDVGLGLFLQAKCSGSFHANVSTLVLVLKACWREEAIDDGLNAHGMIIRSGFAGFAEVRNALMGMYAEHRELQHARRLFDEMLERDVISWSVLIGAYARHEDFSGAWQLSREMLAGCSVRIDGFAAVNILQACGGLWDVCLGRSLHGRLLRLALTLDLFVANSLVDMYSKFHDPHSARSVFDEISQRNIVSWNSLLSGLVQNDRHTDALELFDLMRAAGIRADEITTVNLLQSCKRLGLSSSCKSIHGMIVRWLFRPNEKVLNALLDAYLRCGLVELAVRLFAGMDDRNLVSWSTMIAGYAQLGRPYDAVAIFREMLLALERPNAVTLISLLDACSASADTRLPKSTHGVAVRRGLAKDPAVSAMLLNAYGKCAEMESLWQVFDEMPRRSVMAWNTMISALGMNGFAREALDVLAEMEASDARPNGVTMLSVISACGHGGLVEEGLSCFQRMLCDPVISPGPEHYSCVIDMLARAGYLEAASKVIRAMPEGIEASRAAWGALLSACSSRGNCELGLEAASRVVRMEPLSPSGYLLAVDICLKAGSTRDAAKMRTLMRMRGARVGRGYSSVLGAENVTRTFVAWDDSHQETREIYCVVDLLHHCMQQRCQDEDEDQHLHALLCP